MAHDAPRGRRRQWTRSSERESLNCRYPSEDVLHVSRGLADECLYTNCRNGQSSWQVVNPNECLSCARRACCEGEKSETCERALFVVPGRRRCSGRRLDFNRDSLRGGKVQRSVDRESNGAKVNDASCWNTVAVVADRLSKDGGAIKMSLCRIEFRFPFRTNERELF